MAANTSTFIITDYANGTATCDVSTDSLNSVPTIPPVSFVGAGVWAGKAVNRWTGTFSGAHIDFYTQASDNDPLALYENRLPTW